MTDTLPGGPDERRAAHLPMGVHVTAHCGSLRNRLK